MVDGDVPPLDTFAISVAIAITLMFVTVLLVAGSLALEREENTFARLTRGLVGRTGAAGREDRPRNALLDRGRARPARGARAVRRPRLGARSAVPRRDPARRRRFAAMGSAIGVAAREVRASALAAFALTLPIAFLSLVPSGTVSETLFDAIRLRHRRLPLPPRPRRALGRPLDRATWPQPAPPGAADRPISSLASLCGALHDARLVARRPPHCAPARVRPTGRRLAAA